MGLFNFFSKEKKETLDRGLSKTKESVFGKITRAIAGKSKVDDQVLDDLEEILITSDVGVETTLNIIARIEKRAASDKYLNVQELNTILREEIASLLMENNSVDTDSFDISSKIRPYVIMVVGVNGVNKEENPYISELLIRFALLLLNNWLFGGSGLESLLLNKKWVQIQLRLLMMQ
jgi:fused signal recognition particle receptor